MAVFGTMSPKYENSSGVTVYLDHVRVTKDEPDYRREMDESKISGEKVFIRNNYHYLFEVVYYAFKVSDIENKINQFLSDLNDEVTLWRHRDSTQFRDSSGDDVPFKLVEVTLFYFTEHDFKDAAVLKFESMKFVDLTKMYASEAVPTDDLGRPAEDDLGRTLGIE